MTNITISQIASHYAGMLKAHATHTEEQFAWQAMMTMANRIEIMEKEIEHLRRNVENLDDRTLGSQRIG